MSNYEIEGKLKEYGGVADKDIERTCGNCFYYDAENWICNHASNNDSDDWCLKGDAGCWHHMTHDEQKRLKDLIDERCKQDEKRRIAEERENGTGQCAGCPFRKVAIDALLRDMLDEDMKFLRDTAEWLVNHRGMKDTLLVAMMSKRTDDIDKLLSKARGEQ